jgi:hypothetical protein
MYICLRPEGETLEHTLNPLRVILDANGIFTLMCEDWLRQFIRLQIIPLCNGIFSLHYNHVSTVALSREESASGRIRLEGRNYLFDF